MVSSSSDKSKLHDRRPADLHERRRGQALGELGQGAVEPQLAVDGVGKRDGVLDLDAGDVVQIQVDHPPPAVRRQVARGLHDRRRRRRRSRRRDLGPQPLAHALEGSIQRLGLDRLEQIVQPLEREGPHGVLLVGRREDRHRGHRLGQGPADALQGLQAGAVGHVDVQEQQVRAVLQRPARPSTTATCA